MPGLTGLFGAVRRPTPGRRLLIRFESEKGRGEEALHAEGTTDALIGRFERVQDLDVLGPISARAAAGRSTGREGDAPVDFRLHGVVALHGDELRVDAELLSSTSSAPVWRERWLRPVEEVFEVHGDIARRAAEAIGARLPVTDGGVLLYREPTSDLAAYRSYVEGRGLLRARRDGRTLEAALERFQAATDRDALFADAWCGVADVHQIADDSGLPSGPSDHRVAAAEATAQALALDPSSPDALVALARSELARWRLDDAERDVRRAIAIAPGHAQAHRALARCLCYRRRFGDAVPAAERAVTLEPLDPTIVNESGWPHALRGDVDTAIERSRRAVRLDPEHVMTYFHLGQYSLQSERPAEAVTYFRAAAELSGRIAFLSAFLGMALVAVGERPEAESLADDLERKAARGSRVATCLAALLVRLDRGDEALRWLEAARERQEPLLLLADTAWLPLAEIGHDPQLEALLERLPSSTSGPAR